MIYIIKGCIKTRSTPALFSPATVKWAIKGKCNLLCDRFISAAT